MNNEIDSFVSYLRDVKRKSNNTLVSYQRDLRLLSDFLRGMGVFGVGEVTPMDLTGYIAHLEAENMAPASISRKIACIKGFFFYLQKTQVISENVSEYLKPPKVEKSAPSCLTPEEMATLLEQPYSDTPKALRDKAMLELLYATGLRVSELIALKLEDLDLRSGIVYCRNYEHIAQEHESADMIHLGRRIPFGQSASRALKNYLERSRSALLGLNESDYLFVNCSGAPMSRQGFWKLLKSYAAEARIEKDITPQTLRHSFALHLVGNGADLKSVQEMLGHTGNAATQMYASMGTNHIRKEYSMAHPRA